MPARTSLMPGIAMALFAAIAMPAQLQAEQVTGVQTADGNVRPIVGMPPLPSCAAVDVPGCARQSARQWQAGSDAPGGWAAYQRPTRDFQLSAYWMQAQFRIASAPASGLPVPAKGLVWSRYYDDAVLSDPQGRVHDMRINHDWNAREKSSGGSAQSFTLQRQKVANNS